MFGRVHLRGVSSLAASCTNYCTLSIFGCLHALAFGKGIPRSALQVYAQDARYVLSHIIRSTTLCVAFILFL